MPHIVVKLAAGRSEQLKRRLAEQIVTDVTAILHCDADAVSVAIEDVAPSEWMEKVYRPDIVPNWHNLYKEPGYDPPASTTRSPT